MIPAVLPLEVLRSRSLDGEKIMYNALRDQLGDGWVVVYNQHWISRSGDRRPIRSGETDFMVMHPDYGILIIEVKGGLEISYDPSNDEWVSTGKNGNRNIIKNPFRQVMSCKASFEDLIREEDTLSLTNWQNQKTVVVGQCVAFPEFDLIEGRLFFYKDDEFVILKKDINNLQTRFIEILKSFEKNVILDNTMQRDVVNFIKKVKSNVVTIRGTLKSWIDSENYQMHQATEQQLEILKMVFKNSNDLYITGCAGSGKTLLATSIAKDYANEDFKVLLVCYNVLLGKTLSKLRSVHPRIKAGNFYSVLAEILKSSTPLEKLSDDELLTMVLEKYPEKFDVLIVDEAQDLSNDKIDILRLLLKDNGRCIIFSDDNQVVVGSGHFKPAGFTSFNLNWNLRNTHQIFQQVEKHYYQSVSLVHRGPLGIPIEVTEPYASNDFNQLASILRKKISSLINVEKVLPRNIAIITLKSVAKSSLHKLSIPQVSLSIFSDADSGDAIRVDTVRRFKGLESEVVIITELDELNEKEKELKENLLYVSFSRAKNHLIIVPSENVVKEFTFK